jgi:hypothetical protein
LRDEEADCQLADLDKLGREPWKMDYLIRRMKFLNSNAATATSSRPEPVTRAG